MSDLSLNPMSWTPSNLAEGLSDAIGLPEAVGDMVGMGVAGLTGDAAGMIDQAGDLGDNVLKGAEAFGKGVLQAAKDGVQAFLNPGGCEEPKQSEAPKGPNGGYAPGDAKGAGDTGEIGNLEAFLIKIIGEMEKDAKSSIKTQAGKLKEAKGAEAEAQNSGAAAPAGPGTDEINANLQQQMSSLKGLEELMSNVVKTFDQMNENFIRNIGG